MHRRLVLALTVVVLGCAVLLAWRGTRLEQLPPRPQADMGVIKQDLLVFARAERAFYASAGRYAPMAELRSEGLLSLPPEMRWPYSYYVIVRGPKGFVIVAMAQSALGGRPLALAIDENMDMHELDPHDFPGPRHHRSAWNMRVT